MLSAPELPPRRGAASITNYVIKTSQALSIIKLLLYFIREAESHISRVLIIFIKTFSLVQTVSLFYFITL